MTQSRCLTLLILPLCLHTSLEDGNTSLLREVLTSEDRGQPPDDEITSLPVIPLPPGLTDAHRRPPATTVQDTPPSTTHITTPSSSLPENTPSLLPSTTNATTPTTTTSATTTVTTTEKDGKVNVPIIFQKSYQNEDGSYLFEFEAANSVARREEGYIKHEDGLDILVKKGDYEFTSPEGIHFRVDYQADEKGYRVLKDHFNMVICHFFPSHCTNKKPSSAPSSGFFHPKPIGTTVRTVEIFRPTS